MSRAADLSLCPPPTRPLHPVHVLEATHIARPHFRIGRTEGLGQAAMRGSGWAGGGVSSPPFGLWCGTAGLAASPQGAGGPKSTTGHHPKFRWRHGYR